VDSAGKLQCLQVLCFRLTHAGYEFLRGWWRGWVGSGDELWVNGVCLRWGLLWGRVSEGIFCRLCVCVCVCVCVVRGERFCFWGFLVGLGGWMM